MAEDSHITVREFCQIQQIEGRSFCKLKQQRKAPKDAKASRPAHYNDSRQHIYPKHVNNIDFDGCEPPKNWEKNVGPPSQERSQRTFDHRANQYNDT
jgi:hypothetical protein